MTGVTLALVAIALSPLAYWIFGPEAGRREGGSSPWFRRAVVLVYFACIAGALWGAAA